ncbi:MAG: LysR family transcriptional regulator [Candidatus Verstraetearchaeota archaeon]|nr:LysR family transcriptional regulator [Candidatus Verstraetearchaeota archaeon]
MGDPRISDFLALLEVAKTNSLNQAAKNLKTSPVVLLNRINKLDAYFQTKIFERTNRGMFLTEDGERIVETAKAVIGLVSKPVVHAGPPQERAIRIGASGIAGEYVLPCLISNFKLSNPLAKFNLEVLDLHQILGKLKSGEIDLASYSKSPREGLRGEEVEIAKDRLVVITPPRHQLVGRRNLSLERVLQFPFILYDAGCEVNGLVDEFFKLNKVDSEDLEVKMLMPEPSSVIAAVSEGLGVSLCPEIIAKKAERAGLVGIVYREDAKGTEYSICVRRGKETQDDTLSQFWEYLVNASKRFKGNLPCMLKILYL